MLVFKFLYFLYTLQMHSTRITMTAKSPQFIFHFNFVLIQRVAFLANYSAEFLRERERER